MECVQCPTFKHVWKVVSSQHEEVLGFFMVYADGVIMFGSTTMVNMIIDALQQPWQCSVIGIIPRDEVTHDGD
eukprot:12895864-Prorocentrum_lima.AAC.1